MNITKFTSMMSRSKGFARPNKYVINIPIQKLLNPGNDIGGYFASLNIDFRYADRLNLYCNKTELPAKLFSTVEQRHYGASFEIPYRPTYSKCTMSFLVGDDMLEKKFFDAWMYAIEDPRTQDYAYRNTYTVDIDIAQLSSAQTFTNSAVGALGNIASSIIGAPIVNAVAGAIQNVTGAQIFDEPKTYRIRLYDAFPVGVSQMGLSYEGDNLVHVVSVDFSYRRWLNLGIQDASSVDGPGDVVDFKSTINIKNSLEENTGH